ncbi:Acyltransferase [Aphelenchoides fujianensis]|nr:Acyltransferase [Aphelenchoides fujianensis]
MSIVQPKDVHRRLQVFAVAKFMFIFLILPFLSLGIVAYVLLLTRFWWLMAAYLVWLYFDWNLGERGSRPLAWYRNHRLWDFMADYFDASLVKTAELPADHNYLLGFHPHGILSISVFITACTNGTGFAAKFPGVQPHAASLASQLYYPFRREIVAALGVISASAKGICHVLSRPNGGNAVCLVVGGAEEALDAHPSNYSLVLSKRKGFIKLALREGSSLVPVYSFGENHMFKQVENPRGSPLREFQSTFKKRVGVSPVLFWGTSIFGGRFGLLPQRNRLITVVGSPIHVPKTPEPTQEQVDGLHAKYVAALVDLFETHKHRYDIPEDQHLVIN